MGGAYEEEDSENDKEQGVDEPILPKFYGRSLNKKLAAVKTPSGGVRFKHQKALKSENSNLSDN